VIIGQNGVVARSIEKEYNCRIGIDKKTLTVTINGESEDQRRPVAKKIKEVVLKDRGETIGRQALAKEKVVAVKDSSVSFDQDSKTDDNGNGKKEKVDALINEGTEAGKNLLDMLMSSD